MCSSAWARRWTDKPPGIKGCVSLHTSRGVRRGSAGDHGGGGLAWGWGVPGQVLGSAANSTPYLETVGHWLLLRPRGDTDEWVAGTL